jgi:hypothetical protein
MTSAADGRGLATAIAASPRARVRSILITKCENGEARNNDYSTGVASFGTVAQGAPLNGKVVLHDGLLKPASP